MSSFKEIKERIGSVGNTRKITSAMKLVSSAKLRKAQSVLGNLLPYSDALSHTMSEVLATSPELHSPLTEERTPERIALIVFSSNSSLCGSFNANVIKESLATLQHYTSDEMKEIRIYCFGKKAADAITKAGFPIDGNFDNLGDKTSYNEIATLATTLINAFESRQIDRVELIYHHFVTAGTQTLLRENLLPIALPDIYDPNAMPPDYILEPSAEQLLSQLLPKAIKLHLYSAVLDSDTSEQAARVIAMQTATDNADDLLSELTVEYNKSRQQAITSELLDMASGAND